MGSKLILLVEDDDNLRHSIALILKRAGYIVTPTECVYKAINLLQSGDYRVVISDLHMNATREILIPRILAAHPQLSLVLLTDHSITESEEELPCTYYLTKPIAPERLLDSVQTIITMGN